MSKASGQISRRGFAKILGASAAYAALQPSISRSAPVLRLAGETISPGVVRLSSNENPYGPSPAALKAMTDAFGLAWRYPDEYADLLAQSLAELHRISADQILLGNGSGEILKLSAAAFTDKGRKAVVANPTFEAIARHAAAAHAEVVKVDLTSDYRHDLPKMLVAAADAGLVYICNPNNPTASITPKDEIRAFLSKLPRQTMVLVDEAYHHYVEANNYESVIPLLKEYPNLLVTRSFSKIYGMAGLRCGYCVTRRENLWAMRENQLWDNVNIMALVAARASLNDTEHVERTRRSNGEVRQQVCSELDKLGYRYIPSQANFLMIDLRREVRPVIASLGARNVQVGRLFAPLPTFLRVTIGTRPQMATFMSAFRDCMAAA